MADVPDLTGISATPHTAAQLQAIINRIDVNLYNMLANKWDLVDYAEFGMTGHKKEPSKMLEQLRALRRFYLDLLQEIPAEYYTQYDDPSV